MRSDRRGAVPSRRRGLAGLDVPARCIHWSMDALYAGVITLAPPYAALRMLTNAKARSRWRAYARDIPKRFGRREPRADPKRACVWVHGVSVGEVKAAARLVERIEDRIPGVEVVISVTTDTGQRVARDRYPGRRIEYYPPDASWIVRDALEALRPDLMVLVESELWPNFLTAARQRGIPVVLVNGRMSERSARRFAKVPWVSRPLLRSLDRVFVQIPAYAERYLALGVEPERLEITGNMKFDNIPIKPEDARRRAFEALFGIDADASVPVLVAGSTHPGEEAILARIHRRLREAGHALRMILAPRHPARRDTVEAEIRREGGHSVRRSELSPEAPPPPEAIVLLDTVGELEVVYALADVAYVGGTLVPHGGQNMMEPASLGKPVVIGPHVGNFRGEVAMLQQTDGVRVAADEEGVYETIRQWLGEPEGALAIGARAREAILGSKGATERTLEGLEPYLTEIRRRAAAPPPPPQGASRG